MRDLAQIVQYAGFLLYSVPIFWSALSILRAPSQEATLQKLRTFRRLGPLLGLSLGACIFGTLAGIWLDHSEFSLRWSSQVEQTESAMYVAFFAVWVSNIKLEIWTLDPLRKLDPDSTRIPTLEGRLQTAIHAARKHISLHALGLLTVVILRAAL